jgi:hypothetical protein
MPVTCFRRTNSKKLDESLSWDFSLGIAHLGKNRLQFIVGQQMSRANVCQYAFQTGQGHIGRHDLFGTIRSTRGPYNVLFETSRDFLCIAGSINEQARQSATKSDERSAGIKSRDTRLSRSGHLLGLAIVFQNGLQFGHGLRRLSRESAMRRAAQH